MVLSQYGISEDALYEINQQLKEGKDIEHDAAPIFGDNYKNNNMFDA